MSTQTFVGIVLALAGFIGIQWHDNYTEERIAKIDADAAQAIAVAIESAGIQCGTPVVVAGVRR